MILPYRYSLIFLVFMACHHEIPPTPLFVAPLLENTKADKFHHEQNKSEYLIPLLELMKDVEQQQDLLIGHFSNDTDQYRVSVDTVLELGNSTSLVIYNCTPSINYPCCHVCVAKFRLGYFKNNGSNMKLIKLTENINFYGFWCDNPELVLLNIENHPFLILHQDDGNQGQSREYISIIDADFNQLGKCHVKLTIRTLGEDVAFLPGTSSTNNEAEFERLTNFEGDMIIDTSDSKQGILRLINNFKITKEANNPSSRTPVTITTGVNTYEYKLSKGRLINTKTHIESPEWIENFYN